MKNILIILIFLCFHSLSSQVIDPLATEDIINQNKWVDSIYQNLSLEDGSGDFSTDPQDSASCSGCVPRTHDQNPQRGAPAWTGAAHDGGWAQGGDPYAQAI